jgi:hypothetical protein
MKNQQKSEKIFPPAFGGGKHLPTCQKKVGSTRASHLLPGKMEGLNRIPVYLSMLMFKRNSLL